MYMSDSTGRDIRLGTMVLAGLTLLVSTLYIIGRNQNWFGAHFSLRARFVNVNGLMKGNNVRFSGLQAGTVSNIRLLNDTTIEVVLLVDENMKPFINKNALAAIGTEGLIGNKVVNIVPMPARAEVVADGDLLGAQQAVSTEQLLTTLDRSNRNIAGITEGLKVTVDRINASAGLWNLLGDRTIAGNVRASLEHIRRASSETEQMTAGLRDLVADVRGGKGSMGRLIADTAFAVQLSAAVDKIREAGDRLGAAGRQADSLAVSARGLVQDSLLQARLQASMENIRRGTDAFSQDMEALKHNFLFRGYFKKQEKAAQRAQKKAEATRQQIP